PFVASYSSTCLRSRSFRLGSYSPLRGILKVSYRILVKSGPGYAGNIAPNTGRSALRLVPGCFVLQDVPCAATLVPIALTASSSSFWRRPVIKTYAPSLANSFAVANPIPSVPPVIRAILSLSLLDIFFSVEPRNVLTNRLWVIGMLMRPFGRISFHSCYDSIAEDL